MSLWLQVRRVRLLLITLAGTLLALVLLGTSVVPLPSLLSSVMLRLPLAIFLPLVLAIAMARALTSSGTPPEQVATRPIALLDSGLVLLVGGLYLSLSVLLWWLEAIPAFLMSGRNALGYLGLLLIGRRLIGPDAGAVVPVAFAIGASLLGSGVDRTPHWWAWPIAPASAWWAWAGAMLLLGVGLLWNLRPPAVDL